MENFLLRLTKPIHHKWLGGLTAYLILGGAWTLAPFYYGVLASVMAKRTYGLSFCSFSVMALDGIKRDMAVLSVLLLDAFFGPKAKTAEEFTRYWGSLAQTAGCFFLSYYMGRFKRRPAFMKLIQELSPKAFHAGCELRGHLDDIESSNSMFGFHPHGVMCTGFALNGCWSKEFLEVSGANSKFLVDKGLREDSCFFKVLSDVHGGLETLDKRRLRKYIGAGDNVAFLPGGFQDATLAEFGVDRTVIRSRTGFIKYALELGIRLHPVWSFGESDTHYTLTWFKGFRLWLNKFGIPAVVVFGFPLIPLFPRTQSRILTYVGKAIQLPKIPEPTSDDIKKWHQVYLDALVQLYEDNKKEAGLPADRKLQIC